MEALEEMHAAECETLRAEIDRLQCYAARLVVHNDHLLKGAKGNQESLPEVPPPVVASETRAPRGGDDDVRAARAAGEGHRA